MNFSTPFLKNSSWEKVLRLKKGNPRQFTRRD
jgi:hypothetical protein